jgi:hypothetical protein
MNNILFTFTIIFLIFTLIACQKKPNRITGSVSVSGKVTDIVSNDAIQGAVVQLIMVEQRYNGFGYSATRTRVATTDTTDANGNYSITYEGKDVYGYDLLVIPSDPFHVKSDYTVAQNHTIEKNGPHVKNLKCHRSAFAEVSVINVAPIDTPYFLVMSSSEANITLKNFYKDTLVYLKLVGRAEYPNSIRFNKNNQQDSTHKVTVSPWDTISVQFTY